MRFFLVSLRQTDQKFSLTAHNDQDYWDFKIQKVLVSLPFNRKVLVSLRQTDQKNLNFKIEICLVSLRGISLVSLRQTDQTTFLVSPISRLKQFFGQFAAN